ncbi:MAG: polyamine aminopropyltransferase, partial [Actinomycetota bacterium]
MRFSERPVDGLEIAYEGELLHTEHSGFQLVQVFDHPTFGRTLVLDGLVQTSQRDEFFYHEMLVHPAMLSHANPKRVLIIGAGDGGALRRVLEHPSVERVLMCEIDRAVTDVSRALLPDIAGNAFEDPRAEVVFDDGHALVMRSTETFDVIIVDSSDPVGPGIVLFETPFYEACLRLLDPNGVFVAQTGSPVLMPSEIRMVAKNASAAFPDVRFYLGAVPTYPGKLWSYLLAGR